MTGIETTAVWSVVLPCHPRRAERTYDKPALRRRCAAQPRPGGPEPVPLS